MKMASMKKAIPSKKYQRFVRALRQAREEQGLSMRDLADRLSVSHTVVQKVEGLERRLDVFEFVQYCRALDKDPVEFIRMLD